MNTATNLNFTDRYYNPVLGRFLSADPLYAEEIDERGINTQEINLYAYVRNNPIRYTDPLGLFVAIQIDLSDRGDGRAYGGELTVYGDNGSMKTVDSSSHPNDWGTGANQPGISSGTYQGTYSDTGHGTSSGARVPGIRINDGNYVSTLGPNPMQKGDLPVAAANVVNVHQGDSSTNRGSVNCVTTEPSQGNAFSGLEDGETGVIIVIGGE